MVRIIDISDVDIANIQFDYDLVFAVLFMNQHGQIYSRYGSRTPWHSESRVSLEGLKYTMREVLQAHGTHLQRDQPRRDSLLARELLSSRRSCMHCHEVWEGLRRRAKQNGDFDPRSLFVYPMPENIGLRLDVDQGNVVVRVSRQSASDQAGIRAGSKLTRIGETEIHSQADVSWALHQAPDSGPLPIRLTHDNSTHVVTLTLKKHWKETNLSWRASMLNEDAPPRQRQKTRK